METYKTSYYLEIWKDGQLHKTNEIDNEEQAISIVQSTYPAARVIRKIVTTKVNEEIVYPVGIGKWNATQTKHS